MNRILLHSSLVEYSHSIYKHSIIVQKSFLKNKMNNSSGLEDNSNSEAKDGPAFILRYITEPFLLVYYGCYSVKLTRKYFHKLEPSHILELNILFDRFVLNLYMFLTNFESLLPEWSVFCTIHHLLIYITRISIHADICAGEVD